MLLHPTKSYARHGYAIFCKKLKPKRKDQIFRKIGRVSQICNTETLTNRQIILHVQAVFLGEEQKNMLNCVECTGQPTCLNNLKSWITSWKSMKNIMSQLYKDIIKH